MNNFNLTEMLYFPVRDREARIQFLYTALAYLAACIIPIVPMIILFGYIARMLRGIIKEGKSPHMPVWGDMEGLFKDGLRLFGIRMIYMLPLFLLMLPVFAIFFLFPVLMSSGNFDSDLPWQMFIIFIPMLCMLPVWLYSLMIGVLLQVAECHVIANDSFSAGFRVKELWRLFRANLGGFLLAYAITFGISMVLVIFMQVLYFTIILICLLPFVMPFAYAYILLVSGAVEAIAYRKALEDLPSQPQPEEVTPV